MRLVCRKRESGKYPSPSIPRSAYAGATAERRWSGLSDDSTGSGGTSVEACPGTTGNRLASVGGSRFALWRFLRGRSLSRDVRTGSDSTNPRW